MVSKTCKNKSKKFGGTRSPSNSRSRSRSPSVSRLLPKNIDGRGATTVMKTAITRAKTAINKSINSPENAKLLQQSKEKKAIADKIIRILIHEPESVLAPGTLTEWPIKNARERELWFNELNVGSIIDRTPGVHIVKELWPHGRRAGEPFIKN